MTESQPTSESPIRMQPTPPIEIATAIVSACLLLAVRSASWTLRRAVRAPSLLGPSRLPLSRLPLPRLPLSQLPLPGVLGRLDLTDLVCRVVDLDRIAARLDLDAIIARIDVDAVVARADLDRVISRVDLIGLAGYIADGIDLPHLVRESTGSVTAEMVRDVRTQSVAADHQLERAVDRLLLRRRDRSESSRATDLEPPQQIAPQPPHSGDELDGLG